MMPFESDWKNKLLGIQTRWFLYFMNNDHCRRSRYLQCIFVLIYCVSVHNHYFHVKGACTSYTGGGGGRRWWWGSSGEVSAAAAPVRPRPANWYSYFISTISLVLDEWWVFYLNIQLQLKRHKLSALGELFEDEDRARQKAWWAAAQVPSPPVRRSREKWICTEASLLYYLQLTQWHGGGKRGTWCQCLQTLPLNICVYRRPLHLLSVFPTAPSVHLFPLRKQTCFSF